MADPKITRKWDWANDFWLALAAIALGVLLHVMTGGNHG
jgi:hypothetical protein